MIQKNIIVGRHSVEHSMFPQGFLTFILGLMFFVLVNVFWGDSSVTYKHDVAVDIALGIMAYGFVKMAARLVVAQTLKSSKVLVTLPPLEEIDDDFREMKQQYRAYKRAAIMRGNEVETKKKVVKK